MTLCDVFYYKKRSRQLLTDLVVEDLLQLHTAAAPGNGHPSSSESDPPGLTPM
jgi:hypothetical protein